MSVGVIYVACGSQYIEEACQSASSIKHHMPNMKITLFSDTDVKCPYFNEVKFIPPQYGNLNKLLGMSRSPYEYTLYLDTDTYIYADISEMFSILKKFDIAVAHAPIRIYQTERSTQIPDSFPEMNAGVVLFKQSPQFDNFIRNWLVLYRQDIDQYADPYDQASFRKSLYESDLRIGTLTSEYNFRFIFPAYACKTVKIFHGRHPDLPSLAAEINKDLVYRVYIPGEGVIKRKYKTNFFLENHQC